MKFKSRPKYGGKQQMLRRGNRAQLLIALALLFALCSVAYAQAFGRVILLIKDDEGEPVQGVNVVVTSKELTTFREEKTTNKKGRVVISVTDATLLYQFNISHEGYPPLDIDIKPAAKASITREVTLSRAAQAPAAGGGTSETVVVYTPAEKVFNEGVGALQNGDLTTAKAKFLEALEKDDKMALALSAVAGVYLEEKNYQEALAKVNRLMELEPDNPRGFRILYEAHNGLGNQEQADAALKKLKNLDRGGDTVKIIFNEGVAALKVGDQKTAKARFLEALELDSNLQAAVSALAILHIKDKEYQEAAAMAERLLSLDPGNVQAKRILYDSYRGLGDGAKAEAAMAELAKVDPKGVAKQFFDEGVKAFESGDVSTAMVAFEQVLKLNPDHARAHYRMGIGYVGQDNAAEAKKHLNRFLELAPNDPEAPTAKDMLSYLN